MAIRKDTVPDFSSLNEENTMYFWNQEWRCHLPQFTNVKHLPRRRRVFQSGGLCFFLLSSTVPSSWAVRHTEEPRTPNLRTIFGHCTQAVCSVTSSSLGLLACLGAVSSVLHEVVFSCLSLPSVADSAATLVCRWGHRATEPLGQLSCCWASLWLAECRTHTLVC